MFLAPCTECNPEDLGISTFLNGLGKVNVSNGLIHYSGVSPDSIATLQCNDGYRANSFLNRTCMFDGQWSEGALECVIVDGGTISPRKLELSFLLHSSCVIDINQCLSFYCIVVLWKLRYVLLRVTLTLIEVFVCRCKLRSLHLWNQYGQNHIFFLDIMPACPLYCAVLVGVFVGTVLILIIVCIAIALYILKKSGRECFASINTSDKVQLRAVNRE